MFFIVKHQQMTSRHKLGGWPGNRFCQETSFETNSMFFQNNFLLNRNMLMSCYPAKYIQNFSLSTKYVGTVMK